MSKEEELKKELSEIEDWLKEKNISAKELRPLEEPPEFKPDPEIAQAIERKFEIIEKIREIREERGRMQ